MGISSKYIDGSSARKLDNDVYNSNEVLKEKKKYKQNKIGKSRIVIVLLVLFAMTFAIMARYALIMDLNYEISELEKEYTALQNENSRLAIKLEKQTNLDEIRTIAQDELNMATPVKSQKVYVKIPKNDYTVVSNEYKDNVNNRPDSDSTFALLVDKVNSVIKLLY